MPEHERITPVLSLETAKIGHRDRVERILTPADAVCAGRVADRLRQVTEKRVAGIEDMQQPSGPDDRTGPRAITIGITVAARYQGLGQLVPVHEIIRPKVPPRR